MTDTIVTRIPVAGDDGTELSSDVAIVGGMLVTTQIPDRPDGTVELGDIEAQSRQTLANLRRALEDAGSSLDEVAHLTIYLTDIEERHGFNDVYREVFSHPFPVRCAVGTPALAIEGMKVEVTALAAVAS
ncbi:RidA family protein [Leucobacter sp. CSA1]|uniref:RidA family protein n=1 Tax=Leucobacter chromiisoli TaxID=2796471 RepID=A0A934UVK0_9MICO|nr:RidA family protein [Leucobacter chromiisoli]MBK0419556.1 RidA family protein [Leucobacter chromiisoli]